MYIIYTVIFLRAKYTVYLLYCNIKSEKNYIMICFLCGISKKENRQDDNLYRLSVVLFLFLYFISLLYMNP